MGETRGRIVHALVFNRALTQREIDGLVKKNLNVMGFLPVQVERDDLRVPSNRDRQLSVIKRKRHASR